MAWFYITYSCGHEDREQIYGPMKRREWIAERKAAGLCPKCRKEAREKRMEAEREEAMKFAEEAGLPTLVGTEKQVAWANVIRKNAIEQFDRLIEEMEGEKKDYITFTYEIDIDAIEEVYEYIIEKKTSAAFWIEKRGRLDSIYDVAEFVQEYVELIREEKKKEQEKPLIEAVNAEITVRPENPKTETVAEIRVIGTDTIEIIFPERREDFRRLMREQLKMEWFGSSWRRKLNERNGTVEDRAAEAGHRILAAGFPVRIADQVIREKAIAGEYEEECTRWILRRGKGKYEGWFAINWQRPDDFYNAARRIPGSRWDSPSVVVPPEQFEEVLDFAERYGFRLTEKAMEVVEAARKAKEEALIVNPQPPKKREAVIDDGKPPVLEVPDEVGIDEELRDDD